MKKKKLNKEAYSKIFRNKIAVAVIIILPLILLYFFLYKLFIPRVAAFGCFDDCFNFMGGYFMLKGKKLYSEIFFNHQPLMAYLSFFIQKIQHPQNIYELVLVHRKFLLLFSFIFNFLLIIRYRAAAVGFVIFYELTKFYLFGDRFLAESFVVYPLAYLAGLVFYKIKQLPLYNFDYILSALFVWFVIFMREPYILLALFLFIIILMEKPFSKSKKISIFLFVILTLITLLQFSIKDYFFNVVTVNRQTILASEVSSNIISPNIVMIFLYPIFILFAGKWNLFHYYLIGIDAVFLVLLFSYAIKLKNKTLVGVVLFILGIANLRVVPPGTVYYEAFHMVQWYGLFVFFTFLMLDLVLRNQKKFAAILSGILILFLGYFLLSPNSYIHDKPDPHYELITNYGKELQVGEVVKKLSKPSDTLFLDGFDDLIYWQAQRISTYKYSWYTSGMFHFPIYSKERRTMLATTPPDFYYGSCLTKEERIPPIVRPDGAKIQYIRLYNFGKPSCLFASEQKISHITQDQWKAAKEFGYTLQRTD